MRWPGERDGSRPPGLAPRGGLDKAAVEHLTSGRGATGRGQNTTAVQSLRLRNGEPEADPRSWMLPAGTCPPTGVSCLPEFRSLAARPSEAAISSTLNPPPKVRRPFQVLSAHLLIQSYSIASPPVGGRARIPSTGRFTAISNGEAAPTPSVVPTRSTDQLPKPTRECSATVLSRALALARNPYSVFGVSSRAVPGGALFAPGLFLWLGYQYAPRTARVPAPPAGDPPPRPRR